FHRMLINLLVNAVDATFGRGPVVIEVGAADESAYVRVIDGGCGITEDFKHNQLFIPFKSTKKTGLGVGLYQSRLIAEAHDGRLEAHSELGKGSTFTVWLPLLKKSPAAPSVQPQS
ncbi:MAG: PEP-CTERM system histidine kinase PrsK, partial [Deltaproteobacteria bacterium]|nr:PEP-CTERM system histidine kinase PrsK [Deltaproteobacteria bacterium]